jgi:hypothetical protein
MLRVDTELGDGQCKEFLQYFLRAKERGNASCGDRLAFRGCLRSWEGSSSRNLIDSGFSKKSTSQLTAIKSAYALDLRVLS